MSSSTFRSNVSIPKPTPRDIKQRMQRMPTLCTKCFVRDSEHHGFKRCANCRVLYCSKACQKADWPRHKSSCRLSNELSNDINLSKVSLILMANLTLRRYIEILLVLELDLLNNPIHLDEIFRVQIIIDFEPSRIEDFFTLFHGSAVIDSNPLQGMIQICAITSEKEVPYDSFSTEDVKKMQDEEAFLRKEPVRMGVIQWIRDVDEFLDVTNSVVILTDECIELARQTTHLEIPTTFPQARGSGNSFVKKPASKMGYIELINALIRQDTKNRWLLRTNLWEKDKRLIKLAAICNTDGNFEVFSPTMFSKLIKDKAGRETVFNRL